MRERERGREYMTDKDSKTRESTLSRKKKRGTGQWKGSRDGTKATNSLIFLGRLWLSEEQI